MIERIIALAIERRWVVVTLAAILMLLGGIALTRLPIDAVPDITNKQVQINTTAPALSPTEIEKQITFPIETALAGAPGLESRIDVLIPRRASAIRDQEVAPLEMAASRNLDGANSLVSTAGIAASNGN